MRASILAVGTELLFGQTVNTNATYLSKNLNLMGFDVMYHFVVGDNPGRLKEKLADAFSDTDLVILTGGLGPTQDDLTKELVAEYMGAEMYLDEKVVADLKAYEIKRGKPMSENNIKQAYLPVGCVPFYNESGTAPGLALEKDGKIAICLPGPPREMKWLFENCVKEYLEGFMHKRMFYRIIRTIGIGESDLETVLLPFIDGQSDPTLATYVNEGEAMVRIASQRDTLEEAKAAVDEMTVKVEKIIGQYIYSYDNEELKEVVVKTLREKGLTISSAESCTGGKFAAAITDVSGASKVFSTSFVTYSEESKTKFLNVPAELIEEKGVSSTEVAIAMAKGAKEASGSDLVISITGNAGPDTYQGQLAGQAYVGYAYGDKSGCVPVMIGHGDRNWKRNYFVLCMLRTAYLLLMDSLSERVTST